MESWFELAEIYLSEYEYEKAAYCFEELILLNPANFLIHQVYLCAKILFNLFFLSSDLPTGAAYKAGNFDASKATLLKFVDCL